MKLIDRGLERKLFATMTEGHWAFIFDFDGTLAALHADPMKVRLAPSVRKSLKELKKHHPVWIITGRALRHIAPKVPKSTPIVGEHGAVSNQKGYALQGYVLDRIRARMWRQVLQKNIIHERLKSEAWIEPKDFSVTLHYRKAKDPRHVGERISHWIEAFPERDRPSVLPGKMVYNLLPNPAPTKGDAVRWILNTLPRDTRVLYVGDEPTDENAFRVLRGPHVTVYLGPKKKTAARYRLPSQKSFEAFLERLAENLKSGSE